MIQKYYLKEIHKKYQIKLQKEKEVNNNKKKNKLKKIEKKN